MYGQVKSDTPVKRLFPIFLFLLHIDLGSYIPSMNAVAGCYKTWKYTTVHLAGLHNGFGNVANGFVPV
jgi:hypothetical protein